MSKKSESSDIFYTFIGIILFSLIVLIITFWKIMLCIGLLCLAGWLLYIFRKPLWRGLVLLSKKLWYWLGIFCKNIHAWYSRSKGPEASGNYTKEYINYRKINQYRL